MNSNMKVISKKQIKILGLLIVFLFCMLLALKILKTMKVKLMQDEIINSAIDGTNWPINEVPLLIKDGISVSGDLENIYNVRCSSKISYDDIKKYLIELYDVGFKPLKEFGSQNPNYLSDNIDNLDQKELLWIAEKDNYTITVLWSDVDNNVNSLYDYNFEITLFINSTETNGNNIGLTEGVNNISGE